MTNSNVPMFVQTIQTWPVQLTISNTTVAVTLITAGTNGSRINGLFATLSDTTTRDIILSIYNGTTTFQLAQINLPITSGYLNSAPTVNLLNGTQLPNVSVDSNGNPYMDLKAGEILQVAMGTTITTAKTCNVIGWGGDF